MDLGNGNEKNQIFQTNKPTGHYVGIFNTHEIVFSNILISSKICFPLLPFLNTYFDNFYIVDSVKRVKVHGKVGDTIISTFSFPPSYSWANRGDKERSHTQTPRCIHNLGWGKATRQHPRVPYLAHVLIALLKKFR